MDELKSLVLRHTDPGHPARVQLESLLMLLEATERYRLANHANARRSAGVTLREARAELFAAAHKAGKA